MDVALGTRYQLLIRLSTIAGIKLEKSEACKCCPQAMRKDVHRPWPRGHIDRAVGQTSQAAD